MLQNITNLKIYVGITGNPSKRLCRHRSIPFNSNDPCCNYPLYNAIRKVGIDNFEFTIIETWNTKEEACEAECFWIGFFRSNRNKYGKQYGYNLTDGGDMPPSWKGRKHSAETRKKMSEAQLGPKHHMYGKHLSADHKRKLSEAFSGEKHPFYGKTHSDETRRKMRENHKGMLGKKHSAETKKKMSESQKAVYRSNPVSDETKRKQSLRKIKFTKQEEVVIINMYRTMSILAIARELGTSYKSIYNVLGRNKIKKRKRGQRI